MDIEQIRQRVIGAWENRYMFISPIEAGEDPDIDALGNIFPYGRDGPGSLMYSAEGWMSSLLQQEKGKMPTYTLEDYGRGGKSINGTDEEMVKVAKLTQGYVGRWTVEEGSYQLLGDVKGVMGGKERKGVHRFTLFHDIKISMPPNWIGEKQRRHVEYWEEEEGGKTRELIRITTDFPAVMRGKLYVINVGWMKRIRET
jgi:hypothetical protein